MSRKSLLTLALGSALALVVLPWASTPAQAGVYVSVGAPAYYHGPYHHHHYYYPYYYGPRVVVEPAPVYAVPPPVYVQPAPVYVQPAPTVIQTPPTVTVTPGG